jgi:hypothetical protein
LTLILSIVTSLNFSSTNRDDTIYANGTNDTLFSSRDIRSVNTSPVNFQKEEIYQIVNNSHRESHSYKIGFVEPVFTYAAYQNNSFYNFYSKYQHVKPSGSVTSDIFLLKDRKIPSGPYTLYNDKPGDKPSIQYRTYFLALQERVRQTLPGALIDNITDVDVHRGLIFNSTNESNAYDILFLFHNEYVTHEEYNNLKHFVKDGGTIVFTDANMLYVEVEYDIKNNSVTLVKGHRWAFNGEVAQRSVYERWQNETREWIGSNFMYMKPAQVDVDFVNLPFDYKHSEEQYITNKNANILHNYGIYDPRDNKFNLTVATYEKAYGKGKVIMIGLYGHTIAGKPGFDDFLNFFGYLIIPHSLDHATLYRLVDGTKEIPLHWVFKKSGLISTVEVNKRSHIVKLVLERPSLGANTLTVALPRSIVNPTPVNQFQSVSEAYTVLANDKMIEFDYFVSDSETGFEIHLPPDTDEIQIIYTLPQFSFEAPQDVLVEAKGEFTPVTLGHPNTGCSNPNTSLCDDVIINNNAPSLFPIGTSYIRWTATDSDSAAYVKDTQKVLVYDDTPPNVTLSSPLPESYALTNFSGPFKLQGKAYDSTGIKKVEAFVYVVPFDGLYPYKTARPVHDGNWSSWSISLIPDDIGKLDNDNSTEIGLVIRATDKADNKSWNKTKYFVDKQK